MGDGVDGHGAARTRMPHAAINLGMAQQIMLDKPALAAAVTSVACNGVPGWGGTGIVIHVHGDELDAAAWAKYLGPAAQQRQTSYGHYEVTTLDIQVHVTDRAKTEAA